MLCCGISFGNRFGRIVVEFSAESLGERERQGHFGYSHFNVLTSLHEMGRRRIKFKDFTSNVIF
jgi:hypothetical protein